MVDLHTHTTASDGMLTPSQLVDAAKKIGLAAIAITDHDTIDGLQEGIAAGMRIGIEVVPGIELSARSDAKTHIVGLQIDYHSHELEDALAVLKERRNQRNRKIVDALRTIGLPITWQEVEDIAAGGVIGRSHIARVLQKNHAVSSVADAFSCYLNRGCPGYVPSFHYSAKECIALIKQAGGFAFLAHVHSTQKSGEELYQLLIEYRSYGLDGIEGYYTDYTPDMQETYLHLAEELHLKVSGGSDFHGEVKPENHLGIGRENLCIPDTVWTAICQKKENWR